MLLTDPTVPGVVCLDEPRVHDRELIVSWSYVHTSGLSIIDTKVEYRDEGNEMFMPLLPPQMSGSGSLQSSGSTGVATPESSASLPLPVAGLEYFSE